MEFEPEKALGVINDIQRMCVNDGPGFRTTVFLKGCLLDCKWCHNPEGKRRYPEIIPYVTNCTFCGDCLLACPTGALSLVEGLGPRIDRALCTDCMQCAGACEHDGLVRWGRIMSAAAVMEEVESDKAFYRNSGGGLTVSGGEPMAQPDFVLALFMLAKSDPDQTNRIHTVLDTCGHAAWANYERVLPYTDMVLLDLKVMDSAAHKGYTGRENDLILSNAKKIAQAGVPIRLRVPIIMGVNDNQANFKATGEFAASLGSVVTGLDLLPYHPWAGGKYKAFGMDYDFPAGEGYDDSQLEEVIDLLLDFVEEVTIGG
ncbi:MAG: glycyl-radical enzyme activating protein [Desulfatibacillaceae bacterium]|nr:glycyl-radical enzyme activating protein [Desulfatibacillaceae bacterium]